jgi:hypothetical protein
MKTTLLKIAALSLALGALFVLVINRSNASASASPQEKTVEQVQKNIKVLNGMPQSQLIPVMNYIAASLGRRCNFCHVNKDGQWDYASDEKPEKNTAREMIKMVLALHKQNFPGASEISCFTCHRGQNHPTNIPSLPLPLPSPRPAGPAPASGGGGTGAPPAAGPQATPSPTPALPSADAIFTKYIEAIGGQANVDKIKSRAIKGSVAQPNGILQFESLQAAPDKFYIVATVGQGTVERGFNGTVGWEKSARGVRQLSPVEVAGLQSSVGLLRHIRLKEQFKSTRVRPAEKIGDRPVIMVIGTTLDDRQERLYFDAETGLLLRRVSYLPTLIGLIPEQIDFADYRDVDGVKLPFAITVSSIEVGNPVSTRNFSEIKLNPPVDDAKFNMPPAPTPSS